MVALGLLEACVWMAGLGFRSLGLGSGPPLPGALAVWAGRLARGAEPFVEAGSMEALAARLAAEAGQLPVGRRHHIVADQALLRQGVQKCFRA